MTIRSREVCWCFFFPSTACYAKNFGPKGFGYGQGAGALVHAQWWDHSHSSTFLCPTWTYFILYALMLLIQIIKKNMNKPTGHIWLYFIIKAIKTEPCPYVYIWSGVTVMSGGGQRGTGYDYVLSFFLLLLSHMVKVREAGEGGRQKRLFRLLEELVRTEMALNSCPVWAWSGELP